MRGRYIIRLSRPPAIPTYYAIDASGSYATSNITLAMHFTSRARAEATNNRLTLNGTVETEREELR